MTTNVKLELLIDRRTTRLFHLSTDDAMVVVPRCLNLNEAVFSLINPALILVLKASLTRCEVSLTERTLESVASHRSEDEMIKSEMLLTFITDSFEPCLHFIAHLDVFLSYVWGSVEHSLNLHSNIRLCFRVKF